MSVRKIRGVRKGFVLLISAFLTIFCFSCKRGNNVTLSNPNQSGDSVSFLVLGDWGRDGYGDQKAVAEQMDIYSRKFHAQFVVVTGDNFYPTGVVSTSDPHWQKSFENIYSKEGHQIPWFPVLGNHDYFANPQAEVDYSSSSRRWKMPARYYALAERINSSDSVFFVFTDTSPFVNSYHHRSMADLDEQDTTAQLGWLQKTLAGSKAKWKIAVGHHPLYSFGRHGNTDELISSFKPIFLRSKTDLYISGHDHGLQYIKRPDDPVHYLISAGGADDYGVQEDPTCKFGRASTGFLVMTLYANKCNLYFYDGKGKLLYQDQIKKQV